MLSVTICISLLGIMLTVLAALASHACALACTLPSCMPNVSLSKCVRHAAKKQTECDLASFTEVFFPQLGRSSSRNLFRILFQQHSLELSVKHWQCRFLVRTLGFGCD